GKGMDEDTRRRIFEPFFTTKGQDKGTGLGLATVYGIVRRGEGEIAVSSEPGRGTTFTMHLPRAGGATLPAGESAAGSGTMRGTGTVLLAEDEQTVRDLVARVLVSSGYDVLESADAGEAEAIARVHPGPIDLLVTDVVMPGLSGRILAERLVGQR